MTEIDDYLNYRRLVLDGDLHYARMKVGDIQDEIARLDRCRQDPQPAAAPMPDHARRPKADLFTEAALASGEDLDRIAYRYNLTRSVRRHGAGRDAPSSPETDGALRLRVVTKINKGCEPSEHIDAAILTLLEGADYSLGDLAAATSRAVPTILLADFGAAVGRLLVTGKIVERAGKLKLAGYATIDDIQAFVLREFADGRPILISLQDLRSRLGVVTTAQVKQAVDGLALRGAVARTAAGPRVIDKTAGVGTAPLDGAASVHNDTIVKGKPDAAPTHTTYWSIAAILRRTAYAASGDDLDELGAQFGLLRFKDQPDNLFRENVIENITRRFQSESLIGDLAFNDLRKASGGYGE